ncbi:MAG: response regulator [Anaerolineae bacterium]
MEELSANHNLLAENQALKLRLNESEETLQAIQSGEVDALVINSKQGEQIYTLKGAEYPYRVLVEAISEGALTMNAGGLILYCNRYFASMLKAPLEKVIGSYIWDWIRPADLHAFRSLLPGSGDIRRAEVALLTYSKTFLPTYISVATLRTEDGKDLLCLVVTDLRDQKRSEAILASEKLARAILERTADAIVVCDEYEQIIRANPAALSLCHMNPLGLRFGMVYPLYTHDGTQFNPAIQQYSGNQKTIEVALDNSGVFYSLLASAAPLMGDSNQLLGFVVTLTNLTDLRHAEAERDRLHEDLARYAKELEGRVIDRTVELEQRMVQLRLLVNELTFSELRERRRLAQVLHDDLQQQLFATKIEVEVARQSVNSASARELLEHASKGLQKALETSHSMTTQLNPPSYQNTNVIEGLKWLADFMHTQHGLQITIANEQEIIIDSEPLRLLLLECVRELFFNIVKHARVLDAELVLSRRDDALLDIHVVDHGVGFNPAAVQAPGATDSTFGLFSVRQRLEAVGGSFEVKSMPGRGTEAIIVIPHGQAAPAADVAQSPIAQIVQEALVSTPSTQNGERIRVLLVDDHVLVRQALAHAIRIEPDIELVGEADDGKEAIELAHQLHPDIVIMDVSMPRVDGVEATRRILANLPQTLVVGLSMHSNSGQAEAMANAGAAAYVCKEYPISELLSTLRRVYAERRGNAA